MEFIFPIIFFVAFFVVFIVIAVFSFKNAKRNMDDAKTRMNQIFNSPFFGNNKNDNHTTSQDICEYCGSVLDDTGKCPGCGAVKKIKNK